MDPTGTFLCVLGKKGRRALRFRSALHNLMAVSRILSPEFLRATIIYLPAPVFLANLCRSVLQKNWSWTGLHFRVGRVRRYPEINGPAVLLLFCLAPHGVFPAARITSRAVSSYLAFSPLPALFSKNRRYLLCDTFRRRILTNATPASFTRHAAVWCSDFPLMSLTTHQRSSAITTNLPRSAMKEREPRISGVYLFG